MKTLKWLNLFQSNIETRKYNAVKRYIESIPEQDSSIITTKFRINNPLGGTILNGLVVYENIKYMTCRTIELK
jgi:hypothetical protein